MAGRPRKKRGPRGKAGDALRAVRKTRELTQAEVARLLGVSRSWVAQVEAGHFRPHGLVLAGLMARLQEIEETGQ